MIRKLLCNWAVAHPHVRRLWILDAEAQPLRIAIQLQPVGDSEETLPRWLANGALWRGELAERIGRAVELYWLDADEPQRLNPGRSLVYERLP